MTVPSTSYLNPGQVAQYEQQRSAARERYGRSQARTAYGLGQLDLNKDRRLRDIGTNFNRGMQGFSAQMARRGLLRSGLRNRAWNQAELQRDEQIGDTWFGYNQAAGELNLGQQDAESTLNSELGQIAAAELAAQLAAGSQLQNNAPAPAPAPAPAAAPAQADPGFLQALYEFQQFLAAQNGGV